MATVLNADAVLRLRNEMAEPLRRAGASFDAFKTRMAPLQTQFKNLNTSMGNLQRKIPGVGVGFAALGSGLAAAGLVKMTKDVAENNDKLFKLGQTLGTNADTLAAWSHAAGLAGIDSESFQGSMLRLNKRVGEFQSTESGPLVKALEGIDTALVDGLMNADTYEERMFAIHDILNTAPNEQVRASLASSLFGVRDQEMERIFKGTKEQLKEGLSEFEKFHGAIGGTAEQSAEFNDSWLRLETSLQGLKQIVASELIPTFQPFVQQMAELVASNREMIAQGVADFFKGVIEKLQEFDWSTFWDSLRKIAETIGEMAEKVGTLFENITPLVDKMGGWEKMIVGIVAGFAAFKALEIGVAFAGVGVSMAKVGLSLVALTGPIGIGLAAFAALAGGSALLVNHFGFASRSARRKATALGLIKNAADQTTQSLAELSAVQLRTSLFDRKEATALLEKDVAGAQKALNISDSNRVSQSIKDSRDRRAFSRDTARQVKAGDLSAAEAVDRISTILEQKTLAGQLTDDDIAKVEARIATIQKIAEAEEALAANKKRTAEIEAEITNRKQTAETAAARASEQQASLVEEDEESMAGVSTGFADLQKQVAALNAEAAGYQQTLAEAAEINASTVPDVPVEDPSVEAMTTAVEALTAATDGIDTEPLEVAAKEVAAAVERIPSIVPAERPEIVKPEIIESVQVALQDLPETIKIDTDNVALEAATANLKESAETITSAFSEIETPEPVDATPLVEAAVAMEQAVEKIPETIDVQSAFEGFKIENSGFDATALIEATSAFLADFKETADFKGLKQAVGKAEANALAEDFASSMARLQDAGLDTLAAKLEATFDQITDRMVTEKMVGKTRGAIKGNRADQERLENLGVQDASDTTLMGFLDGDKNTLSDDEFVSGRRLSGDLEESFLAARKSLQEGMDPVTASLSAVAENASVANQDSLLILEAQSATLDKQGIVNEALNDLITNARESMKLNGTITINLTGSGAAGATLQGSRLQGNEDVKVNVGSMNKIAGG